MIRYVFNFKIGHQVGKYTVVSDIAKFSSKESYS
jgi:hypothetical protein